MHPLKNTPVQSWTFEHESVIRIGRSTDNHVVLYSAVVSRHHVQLQRTDSLWEVVNLGANGTYLDGERINRIPAVEGAIFRLARSGPSIQVSLGLGAELKGGS
ncbi:FHA domain-containing protein [Neosynechococcus sphagnicola]|uniref:FHA domain-containing protein n=1 Tax=Neosynechococcus sphagnicola TaxID=1501145 RepID=UPI001EF9DDDF|nr:FHA domain-containing protein [Neosynechococcus sphagnicola]